MPKSKRRCRHRKQQRWCQRAIIVAWDALVRFVAWAERNGVVQFLLKIAYWLITGQDDS